KLDPLLKVALETGDGYGAGGASKDLPELEAIAAWLFGGAESASLAPSGLPNMSDADLTAAVDAFVKSLDTSAPGRSMSGVTALAELDNAERALVEIDPAKPAPDWASEWEKRFAPLGEARKNVDAAIGILDGRSLAKTYADELTRYRETRGKEVQRLLDEL